MQVQSISTSYDVKGKLFAYSVSKYSVVNMLVAGAHPWE